MFICNKNVFMTISTSHIPSVLTLKTGTSAAVVVEIISGLYKLISVFCGRISAAIDGKFAIVGS